jgi:F0F1-type ATP synthase beta subunit
MKSMFTQNALKAPKNTLIKVERTQLSNGTKLTVTSTDANTVKLIQDRAASAKSGLFGNAGVGKM